MGKYTEEQEQELIAHVNRPLRANQEDALKKVYYEEHNMVGRDKLFAIMKDRFKSLDIFKQQIVNWLNSQEVYQKTKKIQKQTSSRPQRANKSSTLQIDLIDLSGRPYNGYNYILNCIDIFSKFAWSFPIKTKTANEVSGIVLKILADHPSFKILSSDNGGEFRFDLPATVKHLYGQPHTPTNQGCIERYNQNIQQVLRKYFILGNRNWPSIVSQLATNYNNSIHTSLQSKTPMHVFNADQATKEEVNQYQNQKFQQRNPGAEDAILPLNAQVRVINKQKLKNPLLKGEQNWSDNIYTIVKILKANEKTVSRNRYAIADLNGKIEGTYNANQLQVIKSIQVAPMQRQTVPRNKAIRTNDEVEAEPNIRGKKANAEVRDLKRIFMKEPQTKHRLRRHIK